MDRKKGNALPHEDMAKQVRAKRHAVWYWLVFRGRLDSAELGTDPDPTTALRMGPFPQVVVQRDTITDSYAGAALAWYVDTGWIDGWRPRGSNDLWYAVELVAEATA